MNIKKIERKILKEMRKVVKNLKATKVAKVTISLEKDGGLLTHYNVELNGEKLNTSIWFRNNHPEEMELRYAKHRLAVELMDLLYPLD